MTERLWVQSLPNAGIFSLLYPSSSVSLIQVPRGDATLPILLLKICLAMQLEVNQV